MEATPDRSDDRVDGRFAFLAASPGSFHAKVVAARLGAEGVLTQLRGNVDGIYPMGIVEVWVLAAELDEARTILLLDEADAVLSTADDDPWAFVPVGQLPPLQRARRWGLRIPALVALPLIGMSVVGLVVRW